MFTKFKNYIFYKRTISQLQSLPKYVQREYVKSVYENISNNLLSHNGPFECIYGVLFECDYSTHVSIIKEYIQNKLEDFNIHSIKSLELEQVDKNKYILITDITSDTENYICELANCLCMSAILQVGTTFNQFGFYHTYKIVNNDNIESVKHLIKNT